MAMTASSGKGYNADINITPLVDVVLVLLIIFMVIVPLTQRGYDIEIPRESISAVPQEQSDKQVILAINLAECAIGSPLGPAGLPRDCYVHLNRERIAVSDLGPRVTEVFRNRKSSDKILFLAAEEQLNYEGIVQILDVAKTAGGDDLKIGIVTDEALARAPAAAAPAAP